MKKRHLSMVLALCMLLCSLPLVARMVRAAGYVEVGDFYFKSDENEGSGWTRDETNKVIKIINHGLFSVKNKDPNTATSWRIEINANIDVRLNLEGVNINTQNIIGTAAIKVAANSTANVTIEVVEGTVNRVAGRNYPGILYGAIGEYTGTLTFIGNGTLYTTGESSDASVAGGAGIGGGPYNRNVSNIYIDGPTIYATGGNYAPGIGSCLDGTASNIVIKSGTVIANGGENAAGIGCGDSGRVDGITIEGGTVKATGGKKSAGIGGGMNGEAKNIIIKDGDVTAYGNFGGAGIGSGLQNDANGHSTNVDGITISGGVVRAFGSAYDNDPFNAGAGIGSGGSTRFSKPGNVDNVTISGGTVKAVGATTKNYKADDIGSGTKEDGNSGDCTNIKITGGSVNAPKHGCQAVNAKGQSVALMTISNPDEKAYLVNGVEYTPRNSKAIDGDTNLYLYLAEGDVLKDNQGNAVHFHIVDGKITTDTMKCVPCSGNDGYRYHEDRCTVSGCGLAQNKTTHNFENFKCKDCGSDDERTFVCFKKESSTYREIAHVSPDAKIYELVDEPQISGRSFKHWYYEKDGKKVVIGRNAKLSDIADAIGIVGGDPWVDVYAEFKTRELSITGDGIVEGTDYSYSGDGVLTILSSKTMTISNKNPAEAATDRIVVAKDVIANIRLCNVYIDVSEFDNKAAFMIERGGHGAVTLTITNSGTGTYENRLISGKNCAGIQTPSIESWALVITEELTSPNAKVSLTVRGGSGAPGIGNDVDAQNITILKGHITAYGGENAPGIGSGDSGVCDNIVIGDETGVDKNGPVVTAVGDNSPGIGSAYVAKNIYIYSGTVTAIGGGVQDDIGCQGKNMAGKIHILGGSVKAGTVSEPVVGASENPVASLIIENPRGDDVYVDGVKYIPSNHTAADAKDTNLYLWLTTTGSHTVKVGEDGIEYVYSYKNGKFDRERDLTITSNTSEAAVEGTDYSYALGVLTILSDKSMTVGMRNGVARTADRIVTAAGVNANITLSGVNIDTSETGNAENSTVGYAPIAVADGNGENVTITLANGSVNTLRGGFGVAALQKGSGSGKLTITGRGTLNATGENCGAGIGSGYRCNTSNIIILDGTIVAQGGIYSAGIGGGYNYGDVNGENYLGGGASNITIKGGNVTAIGGAWGAGIGSGYGVAEYSHDKLIASNITIEGGIVKAQGGVNCAGIGGGNWGSVSNITIKGGDVTALGGNSGAGIGGGYKSNIEDITISGGKVTATGGNFGAGIGGGFNSDIIDGITITGGVVNANGGDNASAIGGAATEPENITISGGTITVTSKNGSGIGAGYYNNAQIEVVISGGSIRIAEPVNTNGRITPLIGTGGESSSEPSRKLNVCIPKNGKGEGAKEVYLLVIANPSGKDVYIDGVKHTPSNHTAGDAADTNLYAYLTDGRHTVKIGDGEEKVYHYDKANSRFIETDCVDGSKDHKCDYCGETASTCIDKNKNHECDVCGATMGVHEAAEGKHTCDYCGKTVSTCIDKNKNHECDVCGATMGVHEAAEGKHTCDYCGKTVSTCIDKNKDHKCDDCGAPMGVHEAAEGKHTCDYCGENASQCEDKNKDHKCDDCGAPMGVHEAAEGKHTCDYCGKTASTCTDENKDHKCDDCDAPMGVHEAAEGKHTCDYCGKNASQCEDKNKDHKCDDCGAPMGVHEAAEGKHTCDYCGQNVNSHSGGEASCNEEAVCGICGEKYGERDGKNHRKLKHVEAKAATAEADGNIEYWHCEDCNKYFGDKDCNNEITLADTIVSKPSDSKVPETGDNSHMVIWFALLVVSGGALAGTVAYGKKRKHFAK